MKWLVMCLMLGAVSCVDRDITQCRIDRDDLKGQIEQHMIAENTLKGQAEYCVREWHETNILLRKCMEKQSKERQ